MRRRIEGAAGLALAAALVVSCGGGGGGGTPTTPAPPPPPPAPTTGILFTPAGAPGPGTIYLDADDQTNPDGLLEVRVMANEVTDLYGVAFDLEYPDPPLRYTDSARKGALLGEDDAQTRLLVRRRPRGNLIVGLTRLGDEDGVSGSGVLMTLEFEARQGEGEGDFAFRDMDAVDSAGRFLDAAWLAGSVEVLR